MYEIFNKHTICAEAQKPTSIPKSALLKGLPLNWQQGACFDHLHSASSWRIKPVQRVIQEKSKRCKFEKKYCLQDGLVMYAKRSTNTSFEWISEFMKVSSINIEMYSYMGPRAADTQWLRRKKPGHFHLMLDTQSPWDGISLPCWLTKDLTGWHYCLTPSCASSCYLPFLPPVLTPNKHLAPQTLSLPLLLKKSNLWQLTPAVVWKSRWWDGLWNRLAWRSPSLLVGCCVSALDTSCWFNCSHFHCCHMEGCPGQSESTNRYTGIWAFWGKLLL